MEEQIPDKNLFMMCEKLNISALSTMPDGYHIRYIRPDELDLWKALPFDDPETAREYYAYMTEFFNNVYSDKQDMFFHTCLFACDENDTPVGTCFVWKAYDRINTIHWFKVLKTHENQGIGRALLSYVMKDLTDSDYPVYLHTQPSSYRAIKLYSNFGFSFISDPVVGSRENHLNECLPILKQYMFEKDFSNLKIAHAPQALLEAADSSEITQF